MAVELRGDPEHPFTRGFLCQKMARYLDRVYSPDRLLHADEAGRAQGRGQVRADLAGTRRSTRSPTGSRRSPRRPTARRRSCPTAITARWASSSRAASTGGSSTGSAPRSSTGPICASAGALGYEYTVGRGRLGADPLAVPKCKFIVNWGSNTVNTNSHLWSLMIEARKQPARRSSPSTPTAARPPRRSDWHIAIRPGTDAALALGLMHVIWRDGLQDDDYLRQGTVGAELLRERVLDEYPPDRVADDHGRRRRDDRDPRPPPGARAALADPPQLRHAAPSWRRDGRADDRLPAGDRRLLAAPRRRGLALHQRHLRLRHGPADPARPLAARHAHRQHEPARRGPRRRAARPAGPGPLRLQLQPRRRRPRPGARCSRDSCATTCSRSSTSSSPTDTVDYADIVLPATSQLEHVDMHGSYGHHDVMYNPPAIAPRGECRSNNDVFRALAARLGFEPELFPDDETLIREALDGGPTARGDHARAARSRGVDPAQPPRGLRPVRRRRLPDALGQVRALLRADEGRRPRPAADLHPAARGPADPPRPGREVPAATAQPAAPAVPQLDVRQLSARHRAAAGDPTVELAAEDADGARPGRRPVGRGLQRPRPVPGPGRPDRQRSGRAWPSPPASTGTSSPPAGRTSTAPPPRP